MCDYHVSSVFFFCLKGTVKIAYFNAPGGVHDSQVAMWENIYDELEPAYNDTGLQCIIDSAFGKVKRMNLIKSSTRLFHSW
jgi:hypothetical protein